MGYDFLEATRDRMGIVTDFLHLDLDGAAVDLSETLSQVGTPVEEDFEVEGITEVEHQRGVREDGA